MTIVTKNTFPSFSRCQMIKGLWSPIYIEPIVNSGEKICVGIVVANEKDHLVVPIKSFQKIECLYKNQAETIVFAIQACIEHLSRAIRKMGMLIFKDWTPSIEGFTLGEARHATGKTLYEIARIGLVSSSSLFDESEFLEDKKSYIEEFKQHINLNSSIKSEVTKLKPELYESFEQKFKVLDSGYDFTIDFLGKILAANFNKLVSNSLKSDVEKIRAKLWAIEQFRDYIQIDNFSTFSCYQHEVILHQPDFQTDRVKSAFDELEKEAGYRNIRVRALPTVEEIASFIVKSEFGFSQSHLK